LRNDIGETMNLAEQMRDKVGELEALIDEFLKNTGALVPRRNPAYQPAAATNTPAPARDRASRDRVGGGWVTRFCTAEEREGSLVVTGAGRNPFLGMAGLDQQGPLSLSLVTRSRTGGNAKVQWRTAGQESFPAEGQIADFQLPSSTDNRETTVRLPVEGKLVHLRLYLPVQNAPLELDRVELKPARGAAKQWEFQNE
jgi:hypothetical protein